MPTYEYECEACGHTFEQVQPMRAQPLKKCPACGKSRLERLVSGGSGFILKGAGFWRNDSKAKKGGASSSTTPAAEGAEKAEKAEKSGGTGAAGSNGGDRGDRGDGSKSDSAAATGKASGAGKGDGKAEAANKPAEKKKNN